MASNFLLYGSYGYTGSLIARLAAGRGLRPTLAGRDKNKLAAQAAELGLEVSIPLPGLKLRRIPGIHPAGDGGQPISRLAAWFAGGAEFPEAPDSGSAPRAN
ncbi:hypothetical protein [Kamptonema formosum]|uniref:hypothetical protein n=1 Tax=Kamptonema formosum TaxID=331992 RepID=UPI000349CB2A|nr:hypothetical protein [Oscillatoria sp. PCC 10802]